jgi:hypothetical protein
MTEKSEDKKSNGYGVDVIETAKSKIPQRKCAKDQIMPKFPFSMMITGSSGSGKTNLMINIMTRPNLYGKYFHRIAIFSPTAGSSDDMYKKLGNIPKENFIAKMSPEHIESIIEHRKNLIEEKGIEWVAKNDRMIMILDDVIAERNFLESPEALKMFALLRHYLCSVIVMVQSYNKLPRALRLNANAIMVFPSLESEITVLKDEITPPGITKKEFGKVVEYATEGRYDFLYINRHADPGKRIRKYLDDIIDLDKFKGKHTDSESDVSVSRGHAQKPGGSKVSAETGETRQPGHPSSRPANQRP